MISSNNLKNMLTNLFSKSKEETDKQYDHLTTEINKGWISSGNANKITNGNEVNDTPVGTIIAHMGNSAPLNYLVCDGTEYNIEEYKELSDFFKEQFGSYNYFGGDGITTFAVPDLRGEFLRGTGTNSHENQGSGSDAGVHQDATIHMNIDIHKEESTNYLSVSKDLPFGEYVIGNTADKVLNGSGLGRTWYAFSKSSTNSNDLVANYTSRPTNTSVLYCINYESTTSLTINMYDGTHYSEDELLIGQWIDGKPLYRKVYKLPTNFVIPANAWTTTGIPSTDKEIIINSMVLRVINGEETDHFSDVNVGQWNGTLQVIRNTTQLNIYNDGYIIVEYTKTTDEPYSVDEDIAWYALDSEVDDIINRLGE